MKINEFIQKYRKVKKLVPGMTSSVTPHIVCNDGFEMSVQAGQSLYSEPRDVVAIQQPKSGILLQKNHCLHPTQKMKKIFVVLFMDMYHVQLLMQ